MPGQNQAMFRLNQSHSKHLGKPAPQADGQAIMAAQSVRGAIFAALASVVSLNIMWMVSASMLNRVLPWFVIVQGALVGLMIRRWGRGLDWRFPLIALIAAWIGAYSGNLLLAADTAADEFGTGPLHILIRMSEWTLGLYFEEVVTPADHIYAFCAAAVAAFLARHRLTRPEEYAFRILQGDRLKR